MTFQRASEPNCYAELLCLTTHLTIDRVIDLCLGFPSISSTAVSNVAAG